MVPVLPQPEAENSRTSDGSGRFFCQMARRAGSAAMSAGGCGAAPLGASADTTWIRSSGQLQASEAAVTALYCREHPEEASSVRAPRSRRTVLPQRVIGHPFDVVHRCSYRAVGAGEPGAAFGSAHCPCSQTRSPLQSVSFKHPGAELAGGMLGGGVALATAPEIGMRPTSM